MKEGTMPLCDRCGRTTCAKVLSTFNNDLVCFECEREDWVRVFREEKPRVVNGVARGLARFIGFEHPLGL